MNPGRLDKYMAFVGVAAERARREPAEIYGRVVFFGVVLAVLSSLWRAVAEAGMPIDADPDVLVWYIAVTEWIALSAPPLHVDVQESIRRGDVAYQLNRPVSFVGAALAEGVGLLLVRLAVLGAAGFAGALVFTGYVPPLHAFAGVIPLGIAAAALLTTFHLWIGVLSFWMEDVSPVYWVWQKALFVLGGLMMPLPLYPEVIQQAAAWTPFPSMLAGPAAFMLPDGGDVGAIVGGLLGWGCAALLAVFLASRRALAVMTVNGG